MGSPLIFIISVIKTKENAVSFKSALSGIHQVQTPLPESVKASVPQPISQSVRSWRCCDWSTAFWNQEIAGSLHWVQLCQEAGHQLLFGLSVSQNVGHNARALKRDLSEWNERSKTSLARATLSFRPAAIMVMTSTMQRRYHHITLMDAAQQPLCGIQVIELSFSRKPKKAKYPCQILVNCYWGTIESILTGNKLARDVHGLRSEGWSTFYCIFILLNHMDNL